MLGKALVWAGVLISAALVSVYSTKKMPYGLGLAGGVLVASILVVRTTRVSRTATVRWIPVAWVALLLVADFRFDLNRSPLDAAYGNLSLENVAQIVIFGVVAAMVIRSRGLLVQRQPQRIPKLPILLFPTFALASTLWSPIPLFTIARAMELLVMAALALLTVRAWQSSAEMGQAMWKDALGLFVQVVTILSIVGFIVHFWPDDRFTWPGVGAGTAATYAGAAFLILVVGGRSFAPHPRWAYWARLFLFAAAIYLGRTRSVLGALVVAGLAILWVLGREKPIARYIGMWYYGLGLLLLLLVARVQVIDYLSRGEGSQVFTTLNSRIPLWGIAIHDVSEAGKWITGFGYGAARVLLYPQVPWAGTAHSAWIEALVGVGMIGVLLLAADIVFLIWRLGWSSVPTPAARIALVLLVYLLVDSGASEAMVLPGVGFGLLALIHIPALGQWERYPKTRTPREVDPPGARSRPQLRRASGYRPSPGRVVSAEPRGSQLHDTTLRNRAAVAGVARSLRAVVTRLGWGLADQGLSSLTNFALGIVVARSLAPREFGAFGIAFGVYTMGLGLSRALTGEPLMVRFSASRPERWRGAAPAATGTAVLVGTVLGLVCIVLAMITHGVLASALIALGVTMPGLLLQDAWRYAFFSAGRGAAAFVNDLVWAIALVCSMVFLLSTGRTSVWWLVVAWGGAGSAAGLFGLFQARLSPAPHQAERWFRQQADLIPRFAVEFGVTTLVGQVAIFAIGVLAGLAEVGAIRAGQLLLGPLNVIFLGVGLAGVPEAVRALQVSKTKLRRACVGWSAGLAACALSVGVVAYMLPDRLGASLLGENWPFAQKVVLPLSVAMAAWGVVLGAVIGLRALAAARSSLRARLLLAPVVLACVVSGAALWGARGAAWGFAVSHTIGSFVWWRLFGRALGEYDGRTDPSSVVGGMTSGFDAAEVGFRG